MSSARAWFREPLVWMVIGIPGSAVVLAFIMIPLAIVSSDGLVADDYYRKGLEINRVLARDQRARALELTALVRWAPPQLEVVVRGTAEFHPPGEADFRLYHPTRAGRDIHARLQHRGGGRYEGYASAPAVSTAMDWRFAIESPRWRIHGRGRFDPSSSLTEVRLAAR